MTLLSRKLSGIIFSHDHYDSHMDERGCTVNEDLEKSNSEVAEKILTEVWTYPNIDGHPIHATCIPPDTPELPQCSDDKWYAYHVK